MNSFALWCEKKKSCAAKPVEAVVQINLWTQCDEQPPYIDVGLILTNLQHAESVFFYVPFQITGQNIVDLGERLTGSDMISALFNESYQTTDIRNSNYWAVTQKSPTTAEEEVIFTLYRIALINTNDNSDKNRRYDITLLNKDMKGTIIKINAAKIVSQNPRHENREKDYFLRFRIKGCALAELIREYKPPYSFFQSSITVNHIVDFRLNCVRSLAEAVKADFADVSNKINIKQIHFLLLTKAHVEVMAGHTLRSIREMEKNIWNGYIEATSDVTDIVAYHYRERQSPDREEIHGWEFFAKLKVTRITFATVCMYLLALMGLSVGFSIIATWICRFIWP